MMLQGEILSAAEPMVPSSCEIERVVHETHDTFTLELKPPNGDSEFAFEPGQFNMLYLFGVGEVPISISGDPAKPSSLVHTIRSVGTVTQGMSEMKAGSFVGVRGPFGSAWPVEESAGTDVVIVAGGIGLAPLRPVIYQLLNERACYGHVVLLYGARTPRDLLYTQELESWRGRFDLQVHVTVDRAADGWRGSVGVVTTLIQRSLFDPANTTAMICGPEVMMRFTAGELQRRGVGSSRIYLSTERNMKCAVGFCGHCQFGPTFVCKEGPVFSLDRIKDWLTIPEV